jgi:hypothetical protein
VVEAADGNSAPFASRLERRNGRSLDAALKGQTTSRAKNPAANRLKIEITWTSRKKNNASVLLKLMEFFYEVYRSMECDSAGDDF